MTNTPDTEQSVNQKIQYAKLNNPQIVNTAQAQNFIKGIGLKSIKAVGGGDYSIVHEKQAKQIFEDILKHCQLLGKVDQLKLDGLRKKFDWKQTYDFAQENIPVQVVSNKYCLNIIKITYIKKQKLYFLGYQHFLSEFTLTSDIVLKNFENHSGKSRSIGLKVLSVGIPLWSSYKNSWNSGQTIEKKNRGLDNWDLKILLMYQKLVNHDRQGMLSLFQKNMVKTF